MTSGIFGSRALRSFTGIAWLLCIIFVGFGPLCMSHGGDIAGVSTVITRHPGILTLTPSANTVIARKDSPTTNDNDQKI